MSEDREQGPGEENEEDPRSSGAARRERRASARSGTPKGRGSRAGASGETKSAGTTEAKGRPTPSRESGRQGRVGMFRKIGRFLREVVAELRKVIWPTRKQLVTYTAVVLVFVSIMVAFIAGLDVAFSQGVNWLFG